ncbi:MAG: zinc ribbon domain-containing protein [Gemmatimonadota bacterium]|nr:zinc ribbon domain-containing protein [Gemmatimonadota bacterium]MDE2986086.1 zinc ribbon domain-containing protein [Gemmatimonadota bacterium]
MPTYDYRCRECGRDFEVFQRMSDKPGASCPGCGNAAERLISGGAGFLFKGDGFYITDYRSDDYRKKAREEAGAGVEKKAEDKAGAKDGSGSVGDTAGSAGANGSGKGGDKVSSGSGTGSSKGSTGGKGA